MIIIPPAHINYDNGRNKSKIGNDDKNSVKKQNLIIFFGSFSCWLYQYYMDYS